MGEETRFRVRELPGRSAFLAGRGPVDPDVGVRTERLQVYWRLDDDAGDEREHAHTRCDEMFVVLGGEVVVEVEGERHVVGAGRYCHFPVGTFHRIVATRPPLRALVIRAPSVDDKVHR